MLPVDTGSAQGIDQGKIWDRHADTDRWPVPAALGFYSAKAGQAGDESKTRSGPDVAARTVSVDPFGGEESRRGDFLGR